MTSDAPPRTVRDLVQRGHAFLERKGVPGARLESELLVAHALGKDRLAVFLELERPVDPGEVDASRELLVRRAAGEPCAYLTGVREFYGRRFAVRPGVLIPRPETELLVDLARARLAGREAPRVLDLGTGSGCLAITLALELPVAVVTATDVSPEALAIARENAEALGADVELLEGDGLAPVAGRAFDLLLCNPPYVHPEDPALAAGVREHEPAVALFAPAEAPDLWVHRLATPQELAAPAPLRLVELGHDQADRIAAWLEARGVAHAFHEDLAGVRRVLELPPGM